MTATEPGPVHPLKQQPNPYTNESPLHVSDHPWRDNRIVVYIALAVAFAPVLWLLGRLVAGARPIVSDDLLLALIIAEPLALATGLFPVLLSSGVQVVLGADALTRQVRSARGATKTLRLADIRAGIFASKVRYRREWGKELILLGDAEVVWIADGIPAEDVQRIAEALSAYGIREYADPITNDQLAALVRKIRRRDDS